MSCREFFQTKGENTKLCRGHKRPTKESENRNYKAPRIPTFVSGGESIHKKRGKHVCFGIVHGGGLSFSTWLLVFFVFFFFGGKFFTQSEYSQWLGSERTEERGMRYNMHKFFLLPLAKRLPVNQTLWEKRQKTSIPNLPLQPFSVSFKPKSQIHLVADLMSPRCQLHSYLLLIIPEFAMQHIYFTLFKRSPCHKRTGCRRH